MDPFVEIERLTGLAVPPTVIAACIGPKLVHIPPGRVLYAAGPDGKPSMQWGAFEEGDLEWYQRGNQLDPTWYRARGLAPVQMYEYSVTISATMPAVMSKVADLSGLSPRIGPSKFQYYNPAGLGAPVRGRSLGCW